MKKMKQLVFMIFITLFINAYAESIKDNYRCAGNRYPLNDVIKIEKTIQKALTTNDMTLLADQFIYPFAVNLRQ